jgi:hypothetical protein
MWFTFEVHENLLHLTFSSVLNEMRYRYFSKERRVIRTYKASMEEGVGWQSELSRAPT